MFELKYKTPPDWAQVVVSAMDDFLPDHAAAEKKASGMAMGMVAHYPDKLELVTAMIDLALEELSHFRAVVRLIHDRGLSLQADEKDPYVNELRRTFRRGTDEFFMDRMLVGAVIEARGAERFGLLAEALPAGELKRFYRSITRSEETHQGLFLQLAQTYFARTQVWSRLEALLDAEAEIVSRLPFRPALH